MEYDGMSRDKGRAGRVWCGWVGRVGSVGYGRLGWVFYFSKFYVQRTNQVSTKVI